MNMGNKASIPCPILAHYVPLVHRLAFFIIQPFFGFDLVGDN